MGKVIKAILFLAGQDLKLFLKERNTIVWVFIMPGIFFFFIGSVTQGGGLFSEQASPLLVDNQDSGYLGEHLEARLEENQFENLDPAETPMEDENGEPISYRTLTIPAEFTETVLRGDQVTLSYSGLRTNLSNDYDFVRLQKAAYTVLGDVVVASLEENPPTQAQLEALLEIEALTTLNVEAAGERRIIPTGFQQSIPGTMVMFTLLVLLTSGAISLYADRERQLLRRLASAPYTRGQIVAGKWVGRMALAMVQVGVAIGISFVPVFNMDWGGSLPMVLVILFGWAGLCTSLSILLGSIGKSEGQISGLGVLSSMILAALGGCWWPIEVAPEWMQELQIFIPTGWVMDALHKLISFGQGPESVLANLAVLLVATFAVGALAARKFRFV